MRSLPYVHLLRSKAECTDYLGAHAIIPLSAARLLKIGLWSCRFWAAYVLFEFLHLAERARLCRVAESELQSKQTEKGDLDESLAIQSTRANIRSNLLINSAYFPLTLHWCASILRREC